MSNNQWRSKGNSYWISPTLGLLIGQKIRIICENFSWDQSIQGNAYVWAQVTAAAGNREFAFFMNQNGPVEVFYGGISNIVLKSTKAEFFDSLDGSVENILFDFEIDTATGDWEFRKNGVLTSSGSVVLTGTARVEDQEFWVGARPINDSENNTTGTFFAPNNTLKLGNTSIYVNDVLIRRFVIPSGNEIIIPDTVGENDAQLYGPTAGDGLDYIPGFDAVGEGGLIIGGAAGYSFEGSDPLPLDYNYTGSGGLFFGGDSAYHFQPGTKATIDNLLAFGASNMVRVFDVYPSNGATVRDDLRFKMRQAGFDLAFLSYAVGNHSVTTTNANMDNWLANHTGMSNTACLVHTGGVNATNNGPWSTWTELQKETFYNAMRQICQKITNAGFELILCPLTYRRYPYALVDENEGSKSINENLIHPLIREFCPRWWDFETNKPVIDLYTASLNAGLGFFASGDNVHPVYPAGVEVLQNEVVSGLMERGILPEREPRQVVSVNLTQIENRPPGTNNITTVNGSLSNIRDTNGDTITGSSVSLSGYSDIQSIGVSSALRNFIKPDATHFRAVTRAMETSSSALILVDMGEDYAERTGVAKITGYVGPPITGEASSLFSSSEDFDEIQADQTPPQVASVDFKMDLSGTLSIDHNLVTGSSTGYLSAVDFIFNDEFSTFSYVGDGGLYFGGSASYSFSKGGSDFTYIGNGGQTLGGQASYDFIAGAFDFTYIGSGGLYFGGSTEDGLDIMAYGTNAGFTNWLAMQGLTLPAGSLSVPILRQIGSDYVDAAYSWRLQCSQRTGGFAQLREWPRTGHIINRQEVPSDLIPHVWVQASYRAAYLNAVYPGWSSNTINATRQTKREKVGPIEREFFSGDDAAGSAVAPGMISDSVINAILLPWLCPEKPTRNPCNLFRVI